MISEVLRGNNFYVAANRLFDTKSAARLHNNYTAAKITPISLPSGVPRNCQVGVEMSKPSTPTPFATPVRAGIAVWFFALLIFNATGGGIAQAEYVPPKIIVPEGFVAELAAAPPLVQHPLMAGFDDRGRLFIAASAGKNLRREDLEKELPNFIRMLEDTDGDGVFDKSTIFADKMTMPQGALWYRGALYVCSSGGLWRLEDTNDDGVADQRKMLVGGFGYTGNAADIHGPFLSPAGRLYWCDGRHGHEFRDEDGNVTSKGKAARIFSCRPDGSDVQTHCGGGMDNPVELDFMPTGEILGTVNLFYRQRGDCLVHWVRGGVYPRYDQPDCLAEFPSTGEPLTEVFNYGHVAVSGCMRYRSGQHGFGNEYADNFFVTQFNTHKVVRTVLTRSGGTFTAETHDFLHSESPDFHPTDVLEDADGSLLVIDTGGWFRIGCPTSQIAKPNIHGAIWRIRKKGGHTLKDPRGLKIDWQKVDPAEHLNDDRFAVRERAIEKCSRRYHRVADRFPERMFDEEQPERVRQNAVWALARMTQNLPEDHDDEDREVFELALRANSLDAAKWIDHATGNSSPDVRIAAWHAAAHCFSIASNVVGRSGLAPMKDNLAEMGPAAAVMGTRRTGFHAIASQLDYGETRLDRTAEHALIHALISIGEAKEAQDILDADGPAFPRLNTSRTKRVMLVALNQMPNGNLQRETVLRLVDSDDMALRETALKIVASHPEWAEGMGPWIAKQFGEGHPTKNDLATLRGTLTVFIHDPKLKATVSEALAGGKLDDQRVIVLLGTMGKIPHAQWPMKWNDLLRPYLETGEDDVQLTAIDAVAEAEVDSLAPELDAIVRNRSLNPNARTKAALALTRLDAPLSDDAFGMVAGQLNLESTPLRLEAARAIGGAKLDKPELKQMIAVIQRLEALELSAVIGAFAQSDDSEIGLALVDALAKSPARNVISAARLEAILANFPDELRNRAGELFKSDSRDAKQQAKRLDELVANIQPGDAQRGRDVFFGRRAACAGCHRVKDEGETVGPDLTTVGSRRDKRDLLEAIAFPSASIARGFESYRFITDAGKTHTGVILRQSAEELQIRTHEQNIVQLRSTQVEEISPFNLSVMPEGLDRTLTVEEISDLVAYLRSLK